MANPLIKKAVITKKDFLELEAKQAFVDTSYTPKKELQQEIQNMEHIR